MKERLDHGHPWNHRLSYLATLAALVGGGIVNAAEPAPATADEKGLMRFPNVQVVNAPQPAAAGRAATPETGLRAYIDPETRQLRAPLPEELARERARKSTTAAGQPDQSAGGRSRTIVSPSGAIGARLDASHDVFVVVRRQPNGQLEEFCVAGEDAAQKLLEAQTPPTTSLTTPEEPR